MGFAEEFAVFLHQKGIIKFGDFTLSSGKKSPYYVDLRLVPSYPHEFRKMIMHIKGDIVQNIGLDKFGFDCLSSDRWTSCRICTCV